jgi:hypothetical protein
VRTNPAGNVYVTVLEVAGIPVGVVNLNTWLELAAAVWFDIVSEIAVREAASATSAFIPKKEIIRERLVNKLRNFCKIFIMFELYIKK